MKGKGSWLPVGGGNLFQEIKKKRAEAESRGVDIINMAIGQPQGPDFSLCGKLPSRPLAKKSQAEKISIFS
jgi:hypothetical protein